MALLRSIGGPAPSLVPAGLMGAAARFPLPAHHPFSNQPAPHPPAPTRLRLAQGFGGGLHLVGEGGAAMARSRCGIKPPARAWRWRYPTSGLSSNSTLCARCTIGLDVRLEVDDWGRPRIHRPATR